MPIIGRDEKKEISLYFHIPFCKKKCPYCHFYSVCNLEKKDAFIKAILLHILRYQKKLKNRKIISIYFGGGTPSLLESFYYERILNLLNEKFEIEKNCEITIEANPGSITYEKLKEYRLIGINRISIGVQSFCDLDLKTLKRAHSSIDAVKSVEIAKRANFQNISIDLMYDIFNQTKKSWKKTLSIATSLDIDHISLYNLTIEENTPFYKERKTLSKLRPSDKMSLYFLEDAVKVLEENKFSRYEIASFSKNQKNSLHNTGYWTAREFISFGPSAFSYFAKKRYQNVPSLDDYIFKINSLEEPISFSETLRPLNALKELFVINLRLIEGFSKTMFEKKLNQKIPASFMKKINNLTIEEFLENKNEMILLSKKGLLFYDHVAKELI
jgi:oxygen-independent coproporphyrinogen III oxidase